MSDETPASLNAFVVTGNSMGHAVFRMFAQVLELTFIDCSPVDMCNVGQPTWFNQHKDEERPS